MEMLVIKEGVSEQSESFYQPECWWGFFVVINDIVMKEVRDPLRVDTNKK